jgi:hypothetical protein
MKKNSYGSEDGNGNILLFDSIENILNNLENYIKSNEIQQKVEDIPIEYNINYDQLNRIGNREK